MTTPRPIDTPRSGFYATRLIRGGPRVPARIYLPCPMELGGADSDAGPVDWCHATDRCGPLHGEINGRSASVFRVWTGDPITAAEFAFLSADAEWERINQPSGPKANPGDPVDWNRTPPPF